jgi:hypothetical protein
MMKNYDVSVEVIFHGRSKNECWFEPTAALVPDGGKSPRIILTASQLTGCDVGPQHYSWTWNGGTTWTNPAESQALQVNPQENDTFEKPWMSPWYHSASDTTLMIGRTCFTQDVLPLSNVKGETHSIWAPRAKSMRLKPDLIYSRWNTEGSDFLPWKRVAWQPLLKNSENTSVFTSDVCQRVETDSGTILSPITVHEGDDPAAAGVLMMKWDGSTLSAENIGNIMTCGDVRGFHEPSLVHHKGRYFLTIRNDLRGYVAVSHGGLQFDTPRPWTFDDGTELGSYNTQQHWLAQDDTLFLVYTRRSDLSNGVVRHRAPLYMAEVDPERVCVIRETERVVVPENGARMGNFCTLNVGPNEAWIITGEWLQQLISGYTDEMPFFADAADGTSPYNRIQYIGDLLLARLTF